MVFGRWGFGLVLGVEIVFGRGEGLVGRLGGLFYGRMAQNDLDARGVNFKYGKYV